MTAALEQILEKQQQLNYHMHTIIRPPATDDEIADAEQQLGFKFNDELKELYKFADGVDIDEVTPCGKTGLIPIHNFLSLANAIRYYRDLINIDDYFKNIEHDYQPGKHLFPFLDDGAGNCYWVDLNEGSKFYGYLYWTNTFGSDPDYEFADLNQFIQIIARAYTENIFFVDADEYLDCDGDRWHELTDTAKPIIKNYS